MAAFQTLRWIPASAQARLRERADAVLGQWAAQWGLPAPAPGEIELASSAAPSTEATRPDCLAATAAPAGLRVHVGAALPEALPPLMFGCTATASPLAAAVAAQAAAALVDALSGQLGGQPMDQRDQPHPRAHGGVHYRARIAEAPIAFFADVRWMAANAWLPPPGLPPLPPDALHTALLPVPVELTVELGHAELAVGELATLTAGDVILVSQSAAEPLVLRLPGGGPALSAHLGRSGDRRAVQLTVSSHRPLSS